MCLHELLKCVKSHVLYRWYQALHALLKIIRTPPPPSFFIRSRHSDMWLLLLTLFALSVLLADLHVNSDVDGM